MSKKVSAKDVENAGNIVEAVVEEAVDVVAAIKRGARHEARKSTPEFVALRAMLNGATATEALSAAVASLNATQVRETVYAAGKREARQLATFARLCGGEATVVSFGSESLVNVKWVSAESRDGQE